MPLELIPVKLAQDSEYEGSGLDIAPLGITYEQWLDHLEEVQRPLPRQPSRTPGWARGRTSSVVGRPTQAPAPGGPRGHYAVPTTAACSPRVVWPEE